MSDIFFLVLRRLRAPLILLVSVYAVATFVMTLIPGIDEDGNVWHMSFFHAFYFVSFMGTTIGFGEIPYPFSDAQRAWVLVCIYTSVSAWLYAIGSMLSLLQNQAFRQALSRKAFERNIKRIDLPFYLICGYGETGVLINEGLAELGLQTIIIDYNQERTSSLLLEDLSIRPIAFNADTTEPQSLVAAGINHPNCRGVVAVTENDHTNLQVAVAAKLMNANVPVICRSEIEDEANNMASFGTDHIINPYKTFARRLSMLVNKPALHKVHTWFLNQHSPEYQSGRPLPKGRWIICGYGRMGQAIHNQLANDGIEMVLVDANPEEWHDEHEIIVGRGTEASTLEQAGIMDASVIIASSDDDANNLSILITAQQLNKNIYTIGRVGKEAYQPLFVEANCDYLMRRSQIVATEALTIMSRPLVSKFLRFSNGMTTVDTENLIAEIDQLTRNKNPITTRLTLNKSSAPALCAHIQSGRKLTVGNLCSHELFPASRGIALLLQRDGDTELLPANDVELKLGDELLFCGKRRRPLLAQRLRDNAELIDTLINNNPHYIPLMRWITRGHTES